MILRFGGAFHPQSPENGGRRAPQQNRRKTMTRQEFDKTIRELLGDDPLLIAVDVEGRLGFRFKLRPECDHDYRLICWVEEYKGSLVMAHGPMEDGVPYDGIYVEVNIKAHRDCFWEEEQKGKEPGFYCSRAKIMMEGLRRVSDEVEQAIASGALYAQYMQNHTIFSRERFDKRVRELLATRMWEIGFNRKNSGRCSWLYHKRGSGIWMTSGRKANVPPYAIWVGCSDVDSTSERSIKVEKAIDSGALYDQYLQKSSYLIIKDKGDVDYTFGVC